MLKINKPLYRSKTAKEVHKARQFVKRQQNIQRRDPALRDVLDAVADMKPAEVAKMSNGLIGASTLSAWRKGDTRCPQHYTMTGALAAVGKEFRIANKRVK
jgi:hypothetical protein